MKTSIQAVALASTLAFGGTAAAEAIGAPGQIAISGDFQIAFASVSSSDDDAESATRIRVAPAGDYFLIPNLSLGGQVVFDQESQGDFTDRTIGVAVRAGYVIGLGKVSIWPRAGLTFDNGNADVEFLGISGELSTSTLTLNVFAPLLVHPVDHVFIGLGPAFDLDLVVSQSFNDNDVDDPEKLTAFGVLSTVGGYF